MRFIVGIGEDVEGFSVPVLNEREIRAAAGMLFLAMSFAYALVIFKGNFALIKYVVTIFLADMVIRVTVNPTYSPSLIIGRWIVRNQAPEFVGARQKRFAWTIGLVLSATMFAFLVVANRTSALTGVACLMCLTFLFFETAFGICLGCLVYPLVGKGKEGLCVGKACTPKQDEYARRISGIQRLILIGAIVFLVVIAVLFHGSYGTRPVRLLSDGSGSVQPEPPPLGHGDAKEYLSRILVRSSSAASSTQQRSEGAL